MDPSELFDFQDLPDVVPDLAGLVPVEAFPVEALPVHAVTWFARLLRFFTRHALLLAFLGAMVENTILLGFLLPGGAVVALSAAGARNANIWLPLVVILAALGMTAGAIIDYQLGRAGIHQLLHHRWTGRLGRNLATQLGQASPLLRRHGWWVMLFAHAFGHGRSAMALAAGASGFGLRRFLVIEFPAALLWSALYAGGGYLLAAEWHTFELILRRAGWVGMAILALSGLVWFLWHRSRPRKEPEAPLVPGVAGVPGVPGAEPGPPVNGVPAPSAVARRAPSDGAPGPEPAAVTSGQRRDQ